MSISEQSSTNLESDAETIAQLARESTERSHVVAPEITAEGSLAVHQTVYRDRDGAEQVQLKTFEKFLQQPYRQRGSIKLKNVESYTGMEGVLADPDHSATFSDPDTRTMTTVVNFHDGWGDHRIVYSPGFHPDFEKWLRADGQWMTQTQFAELLQDLRHTIKEPTAADIVQIARTFSATRTAEFESGTRLQSGDVQFSYVEETKARSGGTVAVPETITLRLEPFRDSPALVDIQLDFRYDAGKQGLRLSVHIIQRDEILENAWKTIEEFARQHLTAPVYIGPAPADITALN